MKKVLAWLLIIACLCSATGCSSHDESGCVPTTAEIPTIHVITLQGPTGMGMAKLMRDTRDTMTPYRYVYTLASTPNEMVKLLKEGTYNIAAMPTPLAAQLYNQTNGGVQIAAINTLGTISLLEKGKNIENLTDLKNRTVYVSGQDSFPDFLLQYLLKQNGLDPQKDVAIKTVEHSRMLVAMAKSGEAEIVILPEPYTSDLIQQDQTLRIAIDLDAEWQKITHQPTVQGCLVFMNDFYQNHSDVAQTFLKRYKASIDYTNQHPQEAAATMELMGVVPSATAAEEAIEVCNMHFIAGDEMKRLLQKNYEIWMSYNPDIIGGQMPADAFYITDIL